MLKCFKSKNCRWPSFWRMLLVMGYMLTTSSSSASLIVGGIVRNSSPTRYHFLEFDAETGHLLRTFADSTNGLHQNAGITVGPNGDIFIADREPNRILRYNPQTATLLNVFAVLEGISWANEIAFGPDGNLYVADAGRESIERYDGVTGRFIDHFVPFIKNPIGLIFGGDGLLYVSHTPDYPTADNPGGITRYNVQTGELVDDFVKTADLIGPKCIVFGPHDGNLYATNASTNDVRKFDGNTGAYLGVFASGSGLNFLNDVEFGPDGNLYVASGASGQIKRFDGLTGKYIDDFAADPSLSGPFYFTFTNSAVPEPSTFTMSTLLIPASGFAVRCRRNSTN